MYRTIKKTMARHIKRVPDKKFYMELKKFRLDWVQKNDTNMSFLSSNTVGVHPIRFTTSDFDIFFTDILNVDQGFLIEDIYKTDGIDTTRRTTSNHFNLTIFYIMHMFQNSDLADRDKFDAVIECYYIFAYKILGSHMAHYFKYNVDIEIALAVNARLSNKFLLRRLGSWDKVLKYRADDLLPGGIRHKELARFSTEDSVVIISDLEGRLRDMIKNVYIVLIEVVENKERVKSSSLINSIDGTETMSDITNNHIKYSVYLNSLSSLESDFINRDITHVLKSTIRGVDENDLVTLLKYFVNEIDSSVKKRLIDMTLEITFAYLNRKDVGDNYKKKTLEIIKLMRNYYGASILGEDRKKLDEVKSKVNSFIRKKKITSNKLAVNNLRSVFLIYIFIRSIYRSN